MMGERLICPVCGERRRLGPELTGNTKCWNCGKSFYEGDLKPHENLVYIISNERMPGIVKIGMTGNTMFKRLEDLNSATGVPAPFQIEAYFQVEDPRSGERYLLDFFEKFRLPGREFFELTAKEVVLQGMLYFGKRPDYVRSDSLLPIIQELGDHKRISINELSEEEVEWQRYMRETYGAYQEKPVHDWKEKQAEAKRKRQENTKQRNIEEFHRKMKEKAERKKQNEAKIKREEAKIWREELWKSTKSLGKKLIIFGICSLISWWLINDPDPIFAFLGLLLMFGLVGTAIYFFVRMITKKDDAEESARKEDR